MTPPQIIQSALRHLQQQQSTSEAMGTYRPCASMITGDARIAVLYLTLEQRWEEGQRAAGQPICVKQKLIAAPT